jgi:pimeloyl-ACP methyl ester carboxylesterase
MLHSTAGFVKENVGVRYFPATESHPPLRIFYPSNPGTRPFQWLEERGTSYYLSGYAHMGSRSWLLVPLIHLLSVILPVRWRRIPKVFSKPAPLDNAPPRPAIIFSHGLTGTGQENALLLAAWASLGFYVVSVHHTDGSSSLVRLPDGSDLDYAKGPPLDNNYDAQFRPNQVEHRAKEILQACDLLESIHEVDGFIAAGFSFGAASAARVVTLAPNKFRAAVLLDGWFYVDVSESAGVEFAFPKQAFEKGLNLPSLFVGSEQFSMIPKLYKATCQLAADSEHHTIKGTGHQSFCDVIFWVPKFVWRRFLPGLLGDKDPVKAYREIVDVTSDFLLRHFKRKEMSEEKQRSANASL